MAKTKTRQQLITALLSALLAAGGYGWLSQSPAPQSAAKTTANLASNDLARLQTAFAERQSHVWMTLQVEVRKILPDDTKGSRHQRFIVGAGDLTLLVAHNIDLAARVPIRQGDKLEIRGRYEWNAQGGVLHFTHRDTRAGKSAGYIKTHQQLYQ